MSELLGKKHLSAQFKHERPGQDRNKHNSLLHPNNNRGKGADGGPLLLNNFLQSDNNDNNNDSVEPKERPKNSAKNL